MPDTAAAPRSPVQPGLIALHGNRAEWLADAVLEWLSQHPLAPLESEIVLVQSNGVAEWFKMALAGRAGVCAAAQVELPARFLWCSYRQVLGPAAVPPRSAVDKTALIWRLLQQLPDLVAQPGFEPVAGFLRAGEPDRLWQLAGRFADLFDQYQVYRPDWLGDWAQGHDRLARGQSVALPVPPEQLWQPLLWRAVLGGLGEAERAAIRPQIHQRALAALRAGEPLAAPLPRRVVLFGMTHLPLPVLELLADVSRYSQVLMAIPNPCRFHWADAIDGRELLAAARRRHPLRGGVDLAQLPIENLHAHAHPLLAAWGRQGRDFVRQLDAFDETATAQARLGIARVDYFDEADDDSSPPLLLQVQQRIRDLVPLAEHPPTVLAEDDRSIVFHSAHSALREVEVLHDQLLDLLAHPPGHQPLAPRDIVVMVPDIERFAPAVRAVFGQVPQGDARYIPWGIADLGARASHPLVGALDWLLQVPQQRFAMSELRDLLDVPAIAARFGLAADGVAQLAQWMSGAGIRWGLDAGQRAGLGLQACGTQNTAWFGLERMLLGYAVGSGSFGGIEAWDEVGGLDAELAGALAALLARLRHWLESCQGPTDPSVWAQRFRALMADFAKPVDEADRQVLQALEAALSDWLAACEAGDFAGTIPLEIARAAWMQALDEPQLAQRFRAGGVTFCTLLPLRAIPFEVVCLLGMNDGDYPRRSPRSDFDLMALPGMARPGDRSRQSDDRQLMLEALLSARRVLLVSWTGRSVRDNSEQPPSVLVSQLRDYLAAGWGEEAVKARTTEHPLQPFSRQYFEGDARWFTYAREWRAAHEAAAPDQPDAALRPAPPFASTPHIATLAQLSAWMRHPARAFLRERLAVVFEPPEQEVADDESFAVAGLEQYQMAEDTLAALDARTAVGDPAPLDAMLADALEGLRRAGRLPMAALGARAQHMLFDTLLPVAEAWQQQCALWSVPAPRLRVAWESLDASDLVAASAYGISARGHLDLKNAATAALEDWIEPLRRAADGRVALLGRTVSRVLAKGKGPARARPEKMLVWWLRTLAAAACGAPVEGVLVAGDAVVCWPPMEQAAAQQTLTVVLGLWQQQWHADAPLPLPLATALALVSERPAQAAYEGSGSRQGAPGEVKDPEWERFYPDFEALAADGRFEALALMLHAPLARWAAEALQITPHTTLAPGDGDDAEEDE